MQSWAGPGDEVNANLGGAGDEVNDNVHTCKSVKILDTSRQQFYF